MSPLSEIEVTQTTDALYAVGHGMLEQERLRDAGDVFRAMMVLFPGDERAWLGLGTTHERMGDVQLAIEIFSMGVVALPNAIRTRVALAKALRSVGKDDDAEAVLDGAAERAERTQDEELEELVERVRRAA